MRTLSRRELLSLGRSPTPDSDPLVHVVSLLVHATPLGCEAVRRAVAAIPAAELHETAHANKLAVVLESTDSRSLAAAASELQEIAGVLTVSIVAHLTERESLMSESPLSDDEGLIRFSLPRATGEG